MIDANQTNIQNDKVTMTEQQAREEFVRMYTEYQAIKEPKYRHADISIIKANLENLYRLKEYLKDQKQLYDLINGMSQIISHIERDNINTTGWRIISERGFNKVMKPIRNKTRSSIQDPYEWFDKHNKSNMIKNGHWGAQNFTVLDVISYYFVLQYNGGSFPKDAIQIFRSIGELEFAENDFEKRTHIPKNVSNQEGNFKSNYNVRFTDHFFRKITSLDLSSNEILELIRNTSKLELKLNYPFRIRDGESFKEVPYQMKYFSRLFEFCHEDIKTRKDGKVQQRRYYISLDTFLGKLFQSNLLMKNYDWIDSAFYKLPSNAQNFYRKSIIHHNLMKNQIYFQLLKYNLDLHDKNTTNQIRTIENSILIPLIKHGYIDSYELDKDALRGLKFIIMRPKKGRITSAIKDQVKESTDSILDTGSINP